MRVLYDGMIYHMQAAGGVNRYFTNLIARLPAGVTPCLTTLGAREVNYPTHPRLKVYRFRRFRPAGVSYRLEKFFLDYASASRRYDLAHPTYYTLLTGREVREYRCPVVVTVWDMIHELFPEHDPDGWTARVKRKAVEAAQLIICISENTKKDLLARYAIPESRVRVTPLASEIDAGISHGVELVPQHPYYLYVGTRFAYKNFVGLLRAFARAHAARPAMALCVVGAPFDEAEQRLINELKLGGAVEHYGRVSDAHLAKLYRCSLALVYPSLYEGFGIPPLEAMSCGAAVVASNRSSIPEVVGDAGLLFDPEAPNDLTDILLLLFDDEAQRERLIACGSRRAKEFSWDTTAAQTFEIYRTVSGARESLGARGGRDSITDHAA
jgi:glycosyltransferase involved in cell wall biosynthesis